ncbi:MAG: hypothetical protein AAGN46_01235 [Acidobacteriota bacterium]
MAGAIYRPIPRQVRRAYYQDLGLDRAAADRMDRLIRYLDGLWLEDAQRDAEAAAEQARTRAAQGAR